jgi:hypothetical protein
MSRSDVLLGQSGIIPDDVYLRKIEISNFSEDPMQYEKYVRRELSDFRPEKASLESDMARDPDDRGGGNHSAERLALRHSGGRSEEDPYLPDGTFLDHEFLERDPRGVQNLPDFNEARHQKLERAPFIKFYNDDDFSVPETGINPSQMRTLIRDSQGQVSDRYMNFDESMDAWTNGGTAKVKTTNGVEWITKDGTILNLTEASARNRADAVNTLSDKIQGVLRYTSPDHRVKISRYGKVNPTMDMGSRNWNNNRRNAYLDHQIPVEVNGQLVNKLFAGLILDLQGQRKNKQLVAQGAYYGDSSVNQQSHSKKSLNPEDLYKIIMIGMNSETGKRGLDIRDTMVNKHIDSKKDLRKMLNQVVINHNIAASMTQVNKIKSSDKKTDLRHNILVSSKIEGFYTTMKNKKINGKDINARDLKREGLNTRIIDDSTLNKLHKGSKLTSVKDGRDVKREGLDTRIIDDSKAIKNYASAKPKQEKKHVNINFEEYKAPVMKSMIRTHKFKSKNKSISDNLDDMEMNEFNTMIDREMLDSKNRGRKHNMDFGDIETKKDSVGSIDSKNSLYKLMNSVIKQ